MKDSQGRALFRPVAWPVRRLRRTKHDVEKPGLGKDRYAFEFQGEVCRVMGQVLLQLK